MPDHEDLVREMKEDLFRERKEDLVRERKEEENEEIELEVKWQQATSAAEDNSMIVKVHVSDNVEAVSFCKDAFM